MKTGKTISELAAEITRQQETKKDFVALTKALGVEVQNGALALRLQDTAFEPNGTAHGQIAENVGIPTKYYNRMRDVAPALLAANVGHWFGAQNDRRMIRTLDGKARGFLSDRYRPLENQDLAEAVLPTILDLGLEVMSCEITETRLYIKAVNKRMWLDVPTGRKMGDGSHVFFDTCAPAIIVSNSEVGCGRLSVETGVYTKVCTNLAMVADGGMKRTHLGARSALTESVQNIDHLLSSETRKATDKAIWMQVRDVVKNAFDEPRFKALTNSMAEMSKLEIRRDPVEVVELASKAFGCSDTERGSILKHLVAGGDLTRYGLFNAVTRTAQDAESYDRATELERLGGDIIALPQNKWSDLAVA